MNSVTSFSAIGVLAKIGIVLIDNRIFKNEKRLKNLDIELMLQLNNKLN